jgi:hypothetical protein
MSVPNARATATSAANCPRIITTPPPCLRPALRRSISGKTHAAAHGQSRADGDSGLGQAPVVAVLGVILSAAHRFGMLLPLEHQKGHPRAVRHRLHSRAGSAHVISAGRDRPNSSPKLCCFRTVFEPFRKCSRCSPVSFPVQNSLVDGIELSPEKSPKLRARACYGARGSSDPGHLTMRTHLSPRLLPVEVLHRGQGATRFDGSTLHSGKGRCR